MSNETASQTESLAAPRSIKSAKPSVFSILALIYLACYIVAPGVQTKFNIGTLANPLGQNEIYLLMLIILLNSPLIRYLQKLSVGSKGISIEMQHKVEEMEGKINALEFITGRFLTEAERVHLNNIFNRDPVIYTFTDLTKQELRRLRDLGFISSMGVRIHNIPREKCDIHQYFKVEQAGIEYLKLYQWAVKSSTPPQGEQ